jgi:hypothetical protein
VVAVVVAAKLNFPIFRRATKLYELLEKMKFMKGKKRLFPGKK